MTYIFCGYEARGWMAPLLNKTGPGIAGQPTQLGLRDFTIPNEFDKHNISTTFTGGFKANRSGQVGGTFKLGIFADRDFCPETTINLAVASIVQGQQYYLELWTKGPADGSGGVGGTNYAIGGLGVYTFSAFCVTKKETTGATDKTVDISIEGTSNGIFTDPTN